MTPRPAAVGTVLIILAFSGCGGGGASSTGTTTPPTAAATRSTAVSVPPGTPAALRGPHGGVLLAGDLPGFVPQDFDAPSSSAQRWVADFPPALRAAEAARLKSLGFAAGLTERLAPAKGAAPNEEAVSLVELYRSGKGASGEVASQFQQALARHEAAITVTGIPGAHGFGSEAASTDANVEFAVGPYYYLVGFSAPRSGAPTRAQLISAAQRLYGRVRG